MYGFAGKILGGRLLDRGSGVNWGQRITSDTNNSCLIANHIYIYIFSGLNHPASGEICTSATSRLLCFIRNFASKFHHVRHRNLVSYVNYPSVPYLDPQLGTGNPCTRTSSVLYFLIRYLDPKAQG